MAIGREKVVIKSFLRYIALSFLLLTGANAAPDITLAPSKTSGYAPLAVYFSALGTTGATTLPFHELNYHWDFGDTGSGNWAIYDRIAKTWSESGGTSKNVDYGAITSHVFKNPGTYTVTLTVTDTDGTTASDSVSITVTSQDAAFPGDNTTCVSNSANFTGCPVGARQITTGSLRTPIITYAITNNKRILYKRGDSFTSASSTEVGDLNDLTTISGIVIGAFGVGAAPVLTATQPDRISDHFRIQNATNVIFSDLTIAGNGVAVPAGETTGHNCFIVRRRSTNLFFYNLTFAANTCHKQFDMDPNLLNLRGQDQNDEVYIIGNTMDNPGTASAAPGVANGGYGFYGAADRLVFMGNSVRNIYTGAEHGLRNVHSRYGVYSHNVMGSQDLGRAVMTLRGQRNDIACSAGCGETAEYNIISSNHFICASDICVSAINWNGADRPTVGRDVIIENNFCERSTEPWAVTETCFEVETTTTAVSIRNNIMFMNGTWRRYKPILGKGFDVFINNNTCYVPITTSIAVNCVYIAQGDNYRLNNNVIYAPGSSNLNMYTQEAFIVNADNNNIAVTVTPFIVASPTKAIDFEPANGSAAHDTGLSGLQLVHLDYFRNQRYSGLGVDIGAIERLQVTNDGRITGKIFIDVNQNGIADAGEAGIANAVVLIDIGNPFITGADGVYTYGSLMAGTFQIGVAPPVPPTDDQYIATGDYDGGADNVAYVVLATNEHKQNVNFGYIPYSEPVNTSTRIWLLMAKNSDEFMRRFIFSH